MLSPGAPDVVVEDAFVVGDDFWLEAPATRATCTTPPGSIGSDSLT
jgi:hypothetical protein